MKLISRSSALFFFLAPVKEHYRLAQFKSAWRRANKHNLTQAKNIFPPDKVTCGVKTYGDLEVFHFGGESEGLQIGNYCSIAGHVKFILGGIHPLNHVSTFPFSRLVYRKATDEIEKGKIVIDDDVWICDGCTILAGVHIGQGAVIAAGSIVAKNVPPYAVFIDNRIARYRFSEYCRERLVQLDWSKANLEKLETLCDMAITDENVDEIIQLISTH